MIWLTSASVLILLLLLVAVALVATETIERENRMLSDEVESFRVYNESLSGKKQLMRRYRHDADALVQAVEYELAKEYERVAGGSAAMQSRVRFSGVPGNALMPADSRFALLDALISFKRHQCEQEGIAFGLHASRDFACVLEESRIDAHDMVSVVQNLLENAYEESLRVCRGERMDANSVGMAMDLRKAEDAVLDGAAARIALAFDAGADGVIRIHAENLTASAAAPTFRTRKARPQAHGMGLGIVDDVAAKYGGTRHAAFNAATHTVCIAVELCC